MEVKNEKVQAVPGKFIDAEVNTAPRVGMLDWVKVGPDTYRAVPRTREVWTRLSPAVVKRLGLGIDYRLFLRLINAGFVKGQKVTPSTYTFSLESYEAHLEAVRNDPEFWSETHPDKNIQKYRATIG